MMNRVNEIVNFPHCEALRRSCGIGARVRVIAGLVVALPIGAATFAGDCPPPDWDSTIGDPGMTAEVRGLTTWNGDLIAGGTFTTAGGNAINRVARWDAAAGTWQPLGEPPDDGVSGGVRVLSEYNGDLIAGGGFTSAGGVDALRVARFDGEQWHAMGDGFNQVVSALAVYNGQLYAGGTFTSSGTNSISRLARWDAVNQTWLPVANSINNPVTSLAVYDGELYLGGTFSQIDGVTFTNIARYNGSSFSSVGGGMNGQVSALGLGGDGVLYAGGTFTMAGTASANRIARWNGFQWNALGLGIGNNTVFDLAELDGIVYAGGTFTSAGGQSIVRIARFDPTTGEWLSMNGPASSNVLGLHMYDGKIIAAGLFTTIGGVSANRIAAWDLCPGPKAPKCPGDLTGDGSVGVADLLDLLACWGPLESGGDCAPADLTSNGSVGVADLLQLLSEWGPCP